MTQFHVSPCGLGWTSSETPTLVLMGYLRHLLVVLSQRSSLSVDSVCIVTVTSVNANNQLLSKQKQPCTNFS